MFCACQKLVITETHLTDSKAEGRTGRLVVRSDPSHIIDSSFVLNTKKLIGSFWLCVQHVYVLFLPENGDHGGTPEWL